MSPRQGKKLYLDSHNSIISTKEITFTRTQRNCVLPGRCKSSDEWYLSFFIFFAMNAKSPECLGAPVHPLCPQPLSPAAGVTVCVCAVCVVPFPAHPCGWTVSVFTAGLAIVAMA